MLAAPADRLEVRRTWMLALLAATMIGFSVAPILNNAMGRLNKDYVLWYYTGRLASAGLEIYPQDGRIFPFMYPPSCAALFAVLSRFGEPAFVAILVAANSVAWGCAIGLSCWLASGRLHGHRPLLYLVPSVGVAAYIHDTYLLGQPNLVLLACMLGAFACLRVGRQVAAGTLIAVAAAIKAFPVMAIAYLIYRRMWRASVALVVALTVMVVALPMPSRGVAGALGDAGTWTMGMVLRYDAGGIAQRPERGFGFKNQSLMALANRLLRAIPADGEAHDGWMVNVVDLDFGTVNKLIALAALVLGGLYVGIMPRQARVTPTAGAIEGALLLLLILMFSPLSFNYFYVWLLYPVTLALYLGSEAPRRSIGRWGLLGAGYGSLGLLALSLVSARTAAGYGNSFFAAVVLLVALGGRLATLPDSGSPLALGLGWVARRRSRPAAPANGGSRPTPPAPRGGRSRRSTPSRPV